MPVSSGLVLILKSNTDGEDSDSLIEEMKRIGLKGCFLQVLTFQFVHLEDLLFKLQHPHMYCGMILTSPRAVEAIALALRDHLQEWNTQLCSEWTHKSIFVVGPKTASLTEAKLSLTAIGDGSGNAQSLADKIIQIVASGGKPLLYPCGNLKRENLAAALQHKDISLDTINTYLTECHPDLEENIKTIIQEQGSPEYIVFYSPSGLKFSYPYLIQLGVPLHQCKLVAIGPVTQSSLEAKGLAVHCTAAQPTAGALVDALVHSR